MDTCDAGGISRKTVKLRPIAVIKGWGVEFRKIEVSHFLEMIVFFDKNHHIYDHSNFKIPIKDDILRILW